ncbi:C-X-C chemokine receptor type 3-like isoform 1-T4 [Odontesthes bonariensis]|uniref:C-X-C chemokine receptor type 3-like n=1 Tax=Odontesthes bonariensis TaxID=219752 RepID=UPI003F58A32C
MAVLLDGLFRQNTTYDYDEDYEYKEEFEERGSEAVWIPIVYSVVLLVGLLGNALLLVALYQKRRSWSLSDTFILHLSVADILLLVTLPFRAAQAAQDSGWCFGIFCKICGAVFNINFYCGIFLLVCISLDHYLSSAHDVQLYPHSTPSSVHVYCFAVWLISLLLTIPDWIFLRPKTEQRKTQCVHGYPKSEFDWHLFSRVLHHLVGFLLPTIILIVCCSYVLLRLQRRSKSLVKKRPAMAILPFVVVFLLCWMPYNITLFVDTLCNIHKDPQNNNEGSLKTALSVFSALGCAHACLRPLLYLFFCGNFRKQTLRLLRCTTVECKSSLWELGVGEEAPHEQEQSAEELKQMTSPEHQVHSVQA